MKYGGYGHPCSDGFEGEIEDYTVNILGGTWLADTPEDDSQKSFSSKPNSDADLDSKTPVITDRSDAQTSAIKATDLAVKVNLKVYPNPSRGPVTIELEGFGQAPVEVAVVNQLGMIQLVRSLPAGQRSITISADGTKLPAGSYMIMANDGKQRITKQLMIID